MAGTICPRCGSVIQEWTHGVCFRCVQIEKEQKRYGRRRPNFPTTSPGPDGSSSPPDPELSSSTEPVHDVRTLLDDVNRFLSDCLGSQIRLSHILLEDGVEQSEVQYLKQHHLSSFVNDVLDGWCRWLEQTLQEKQYRVLVSMYGLNGEPSLSLARISEVHGLSMPDCNRLWNEALIYLKRGGRQSLERIVVTTAVERLDVEAANATDERAS